MDKRAWSIRSNYNTKVSSHVKFKGGGARDVNEDCATVYTIAFLEKVHVQPIYGTNLLLVVFADIAARVLPVFERT